MMKIEFYKYQGTGNDFVIVDNRKNDYDFLTSKQVKYICDRNLSNMAKKETKKSRQNQ